MNIKDLLTNWKTTVQGLLSALIGISAVAPTLSFLTPKQAGTLVGIGAIAKVVIGVLQKDGIVVPPSSKVETTTTITTPPAQ